MYKPHIAKIDSHYMNIAAFLFFGAISLWFFWGNLPSGGKYYLLTSFGSSTIGTATKVQPRANMSLNTWTHLPFEEIMSSEYFFTYQDQSGTQHKNSIYLVDDFIENKSTRDGEKRFTRKHIYAPGQTEEVRYLERWPAVFLPISCLAPLKFDMKVMFGSLLALLAFALLFLLQIRSLLKFKTTNKRY